MTKFSDYFTSETYLKVLPNSSVDVTLDKTGHTLYLKIDSKEKITAVSYQGKLSPWLSSMCEILEGKSLNEALLLSRKKWEVLFQEDTSFWDYLHEDAADEEVFFYPLELLRASLDLYRGREFLYEEMSPLICRCFGVRESDVLSYLKKNPEPNLEDLTKKTKAGMGCRSCLPQMRRLLSLNGPKNRERFHKDKSHADWLLDIDYMLSCFPESLEWKMNVESFKDKRVTISFDKDVSQSEEEEVAQRLQGFLAAGVDLDLSFFLSSSKRTRHFSKA